MGCEICGNPRVSWRGGVHVCTVCSSLYDAWAAGKDPRPALAEFVARTQVDAHGGPLEAARERARRKEGR